MRSRLSRIGRTALSKNATGVTKRTAAAASLRPDVRASAAASGPSRPHDASCRPSRVSGLKIGRINMTIQNGLLVAAAVVCSISVVPAFAKTAKECTAEWRADKAGMQARGVTEKAYVEQCKGGAAPAASAPPQRPTAATLPPAVAPSPSTSTSSSQKTAKECVAEWRADKAGMRARGVTERA